MVGSPGHATEPVFGLVGDRAALRVLTTVKRRAHQEAGGDAEDGVQDAKNAWNEVMPGSWGARRGKPVLTHRQWPGLH